MKSEDLKTTAYHHPVFKGLGRKRTIMGIPTTWFLCTVSVVAFMAMLFGLILVDCVAGCTADDGHYYQNG
ncbi:hypothetical protein OURE66S_03580 [Oligella ureolytica]